MRCSLSTCKTYLQQVCRCLLHDWVRVVRAGRGRWVSLTDRRRRFPAALPILSLVRLKHAIAARFFRTLSRRWPAHCDPKEKIMDRRNFIRSFLILTGATAMGSAAGLVTMAGDVQAASAPSPKVQTPDADLPSEGAQEAQRRRGGGRRGGFRGRGGRRWRGRSRWGHRYRPYGRPRRRCVWRRNRWGNLRRVCY